MFDFAMKQDTLLISTWFESNYNLVHMLEKPEARNIDESPDGGCNLGGMP